MKPLTTGLANFNPRRFSGQRVGLVSHPAAVLPDLTPALDALQAAGVQVTALFGPEHGFSGSAADGAHVADGREPRSGLPVFSLYGSTQEPTPDMLASVDTLVFDMQDVGVRFYTYLSTLYYVLRGAGQAGKPVVVLDRPNPINGLTIEGPGIQPGFESFVGVIDLPIRHGLTLGEAAQYMNAEHRLDADLTVIPMQGWKRSAWFSATGLPWVPTSPAMPHPSTTIVYPGLCFLEGTNLSVGRGTGLPFEVCGAPWLDGFQLAQALNALDLPGVRFRPTAFTPCAAPWAGQACSGVQVHVLDADALIPTAMGLHLVATLHRLFPQDFAWNPSYSVGQIAHFDRLLGSTEPRQAIEAGCDLAPLLVAWEANASVFARKRAPYLIYGADGD